MMALHAGRKAMSPATWVITTSGDSDGPKTTTPGRDASMVSVKAARFSYPMTLLSRSRTCSVRTPRTVSSGSTTPMRTSSLLDASVMSASRCVGGDQVGAGDGGGRGGRVAGGLESQVDAPGHATTVAVGQCDAGRGGGRDGEGDHVARRRGGGLRPARGGARSGHERGAHGQDRHLLVQGGLLVAVEVEQDVDLV